MSLLVGILNYKCTASALQKLSLTGKLSTRPFARFKQWGEWCLFRKEKKKKKNKRKKHTFADHTWVLWPLGFLNAGGGAESVVPFMVGGTSVIPVRTELSCGRSSAENLTLNFQEWRLGIL